MDLVPVIRCSTLLERNNFVPLYLLRLIFLYK